MYNITALYGMVVFIFFIESKVEHDVYLG